MMQQIGDGWIKWYCNLEDHHFYTEVHCTFISDSFNLYGLKQQFDHFEESVQMILSPMTPTDEDLKDEQFMEVYNQAAELYGLIHARFILTPHGLMLMKSKYLMGRFGVCPRVLCDRQNVLPVGMSCELRTSRVKIYCPRCQDVYAPKKRMNDVDGSFFGCSFPHIFMTAFVELEPIRSTQSYIPKIFGFKVQKKKGSVFYSSGDPEEVYYYGEKHIKRLALLQQEYLMADQEDNGDEQIKCNGLPQNILAGLDN